MRLTPRVYAPFDYKGERFMTSLPGEPLGLGPGRIHYSARSFHWVDKGTSLSDIPSEALSESIAKVFSNIEEAAQGSSCERRKMGCIITDLKLREIARGYNAKPPTMSGECSKIGCIPSITCRLTTHAEQHALKAVLDARNSLVFCTAAPCLDCCKVINSLGVKAVFYREERDQPEYDRPTLSALTLYGSTTLVKVED